MFEASVAFFLFSILALIIGIGFYGALGGFEDHDEWWKMSYDEEMDWLMNEQGLSYEEAREIAEIPHRVLDK